MDRPRPPVLFLAPILPLSVLIYWYVPLKLDEVVMVVLILVVLVALIVPRLGHP